ncbi:hypothetical protein [Nocardia acididurans]|nr:hypothetical protein [Nocardia acididurans]
MGLQFRVQGVCRAVAAHPRLGCRAVHAGLEGDIRVVDAHELVAE